MALEKSSVTFVFQAGLETLKDPNQIAIGEFTSLNNTQFIKRNEGNVLALNKRNGFGSLPKSVGTVSYISTFKDTLLGVAQYTPSPQVQGGPALVSYSNATQSWTSTGNYKPLAVTTLPAIRNTYEQGSPDAATAPNGLVCITYYTSGETIPYKYAIIDGETGQNVITPTSITSSGGSQLFPPRVFYFNDKFVIAHDVLTPNTLASSFFLQLLTIPSSSPSSIGSVTTISSAMTDSFATTGGAFDGVVSSGNLFLSWSRISGLDAAKIDNNMTRSNIVTIASQGGLVSVFADKTVGSNSTIYTAFRSGSSNTLGAVATDSDLVTKFSRQTITASGSSTTINNVTGTAQRGSGLIFFETTSFYVYNASLATNKTSVVTISSAGTMGLQSIISRCTGLVSKAFLIDSVSMALTAYESTYQPTYFLIDQGGNVLSTLAYSNGGGYRTSHVLSNVTLGSASSFKVPYLIKDTITPVSKVTNDASSSTGIYSELGVNLASFKFGTSQTFAKEAGQNLNLNGGFLWGYDGLRATENNFFLYPDDVKVSGSAFAGSMAPQTYFYQVTYEYTDNQGNIYRSAPSIPKGVTLASGTSAIDIQGPNLRLTYKGSPNYPTVNYYRWSTAQQTYYRVTPPNVMTPAFMASDSFLFIDDKTDQQILGNELLYTVGGVVENTGMPPCNAMAVWDARLWLVSSENQNLLLFSKKIIEATPVEMSDLLTYFVQPNAGTQTPTGPIKAIAPMDDKLIIFKRNAIYYIAGSGPDNTGANNQYSEPIFVNGSIGCINKNSVVLTPNGLMFQSDNGIWMLGRDLSLKYVGETINEDLDTEVISSVYVPGTSEVRFTLRDGEVIVYDYLVGQWGNNTGVSALSSTIYKNLHTFVNGSGSLFQETIGTYLDGSQAVTTSFTTGWMNFAGLQGYSRLYKMFMLGEFRSYHRLKVDLAYDYNPAIVQTCYIDPSNVIGSGSMVEQWQINPSRQQCQSVQLTVSEISSSSAGAGLSISGFNCVVGLKKGYPGNVPSKQRTT